MKPLPTLFFGILLALSSCKKPTSNEDGSSALPPAPSGKDFSPLTQIVQSNLMQLGGNARLVLIYKDGTVLYKQYFGSWNDNTYIPVASGSKWPSMAVIMSLVDAGRLSLNDKVSQHYPIEYAASDRKDITLRQLMSHTAGFAGGSAWISSDDINLQQATKGIGAGGTIGPAPTNAVGMPHAPAGSKFAYGGVSMHVAGGIAEKVTGKSWDVLFKERVGDRCNMPNTNYTALGLTTNYRIAGGAGTRMMEYASFLLMLLNDGKFNGEQVLNASSVAEMLKDQTGGVPIAFTPYSGDALREGYRYGLGCWIEGYKNRQPSEFGDQGAFGFSPWIDKGRNVVGIFFVQRSLGAVNSQPTVDSAPYTLIRKKVAEILGN
jgi:CubicO group peptidase (beta-lactamase class C family)